MTTPIQIVDYDPRWPEVFQNLCDRLQPAITHVAIAVEHVGSTSVPGLAAKPVIDMDVVVCEADVGLAIAGLANLGYVHRGNLGIAGREAFTAPAELPAHHLYVCVEHSLPLRNHLALRDALRAGPQLVREYGELKLRLAREFPTDIDEYVAGKTRFILAILEAAGFSDESLNQIHAVNQPPR